MDESSIYDASNVAMIPPVPDIHWTSLMTFHLCEAPIVLDSREYTKYYRWHTDRGHYLIIDNGASVGGTVTDNELVKAATRVNADEVVVPDRMADPEVTLQRAEKFLSEHLNAANSLMLVPQGTNFDEWLHNLEDLLSIYERKTGGSVLVKRRIVIGIAKHMHARVVDGRGALVAQCALFNLTCHLLGASDDPLEDIRLLEQPNVRGLDTSLPFAMAQDGYMFVSNQVSWSLPPLKGPRKSLDFWTSSELLGRQNMETYLTWVKSGHRTTSRR